MVQETGLPDFLLRQPLAEVDAFVIFLLTVSHGPAALPEDIYANLLLCAFSLDGFLGVLRSWGRDMVRLDLEIFLLLGICNSQSDILRSGIDRID